MQVLEYGAGDGTVLRTSALLDERGNSGRNNRSKKVIPWSQVMFFNADHMGITEDPSFADNLLYFLLERPDD